MGVSNHLYLAAISSKPDVAVNAVSGLGLNWIPVQWQCGGRSQTGMEVWMAQGVPSGDGAVTATLDAVPVNTVIVVSRYSGVDAVSAIGNMVSGNTNGVDGLCSDGADSAAYSLDLTTAVDGSVVYAAVAIRNRQHDPGTAYTEQIEVNQGILPCKIKWYWRLQMWRWMAHLAKGWTGRWSASKFDPAADSK
jgi:hypothetical protein